MTPRILNLQVRALGATEVCAPDVHYVPIGDDSVVAFDANTLIAVEYSKGQYEALTRPHSALDIAHSEPPHELLFSNRRPKFDLSPERHLPAAHAPSLRPVQSAVQVLLDTEG